ncbi:hypothetical protein FDP22_22190 (plasmid) [Paroceanicella profunda]|uniref:Uncharacterized protein n=1 Tax=Paroceanicella profunda TaxID=2579971 RepID=A0A5B8FJM0_9RHOB|nr:hypothetical protein [Paroceanicella profunda]QDL94587.1 hypothetical protein FDP22_22190 [Paroceanicella profunda]
MRASLASARRALTAARVSLTRPDRGFGAALAGIATAIRSPETTLAGFGTLLAALMLRAGAAVAQADDTDSGSPPLVFSDPAMMAQAGQALVLLFVLALLLESALTLLFDWRVFLAYFDRKGWKTPIAFAVAWLMVWKFDLDVVASLIAIYRKADAVSGPVSGALTALILAGGSAGVNRLMRGLGFRSSHRAEEVAPSPPGTRAWVSVRVTRSHSTGPVAVTVSEVPDGTPEPAAIAGTVGTRPPGLRQLMFRDPNRFPGSGGYAVEAGPVYRIGVLGQDAQGTPLPDPLAGRSFRFAPGAIVDIEVTL